MNSATRTAPRWLVTAVLLVGLTMFAQVMGTGGIGVSTAQAQSSAVTAFPTRLVFEDGERVGELSVNNRSKRPTVYRIEFRPMQMTESGRLVTLAKGQKDVVARADKMLRFSPRRILLKPGETQTVRVLVRRPPDLKPGEYRSRVTFKAEPLARRTLGQKAKNEQFGVGVQLASAVSLPIIVRHGETSSTASIDDLEFHPAAQDHSAVQDKHEAAKTPAHVSLRLNRTGEESLSGRLEAIWQPSKQGQPQVIGRVVGLAVYTELSHIRWNLPLIAPKDGSLKNGQLILRFYDTQDGDHLVAQEELRIP